MNDKELWDEIYFILKDITNNTDEKIYEQKIIQVLDKMGWRQHKGEIILKQNIPVGAAQSMRPDIIVKSNNEDIFVIEVKKPSIPFTERHEGQLFSYMRQLRLEYGILFGSKIQIFYEDRHKPLEEPILLKTIELNDSDDNLDFMKIFKKSIGIKQSLNDYAKERIEILNSAKEQEALKSKFSSPEFNESLKKEVRDFLLNNWSEEVVDSVLDDLKISLENYPIRDDADLTERITPVAENNGVEYIFMPDEDTFKQNLIENSIGYIKILYRNRNEEIKTWNANNFTNNSGLRGNINSKTWFRPQYVQENGVYKAFFSINEFN